MTYIIPYISERGFLRLAFDNPKGAIEDLKLCTQDNPEDIKAWMKLGGAYKNTEQ